MSKFSQAIEFAARESSEKDAGRLTAQVRETGASNDLGARLLLREQFSSLPDVQFDEILEGARCHDGILAMIKHGGVK